MSSEQSGLTPPPTHLLEERLLPGRPSLVQGGRIPAQTAVCTGFRHGGQSVPAALRSVQHGYGPPCLQASALVMKPQELFLQIHF